MTESTMADNIVESHVDSPCYTTTLEDSHKLLIDDYDAGK